MAYIHLGMLNLRKGMYGWVMIERKYYGGLYTPWYVDFVERRVVWVIEKGMFNNFFFNT